MCFLVLCILLPQVSGAQTAVIKGKVVDSRTDEALPGATVIVKGTTIGTITNADGNFTINAGPQQTLVISSIGYRPFE